jgi:hypothetical protein
MQKTRPRPVTGRHEIADRIMMACERTHAWIAWLRLEEW